MSCQECHWISGHAHTCSGYASDREYDVSALLSRLEALEERVRELEEAARQQTYAEQMKGTAGE